MISLVITIIVLIILSAIAFFASNDTIANATYSTYVSNVAEVASAFEKTALDMNSEEELIKDPKLDEQIYNYVARGGENLEFLEYEELPYYTLISEEVSIGMDLPSMKVESGTGHVIPIKYASTLQGKIFTWPPYEHEGKLYITQEDTVEHKMQEQITVGGERLTIVIDSGDGSLLEAPSGEGYYEPDWGEDLPFESTPPDQDPDQEAHLFTSKTPTPEYLVSEATCTTPAIYYYKCISCDLKGTTTYTYEKALGHQWDTYKITKVATCNESGTKQRECLRCKDVETVVIAKDTKNHVGSEVEEVTRVASCTETERKTTKCSACNVVLKVQEGNKNPENHTGGESTQVTKPATCIENGTKVTSCVGCNKVLKTEAIPAFGHSFGNFVEVKEPTCSVKGVKQKTCTTCGTTENEEIPLDANNHKGSTAGEERTEPTCTENGKIVRKCSLCGGILSTETILYLGHKYNSVVTEPTLEAGGYTTHTCERCGDTYQDNFTEKLSLEAYAIYSETDNSLRFYKNTDKVKVGDTYKNLKVTGKYEDIETSDYENVSDIPWTSYSGDILKVIVEDEIVPISTKRWFAGFKNATSMDLAKLNTSKVTTMRQMFRECENIQTLSINHFNTAEVTDMYAMFWGAISLEQLNLSNWDTSKVTDMAYMFGVFEKEMALKEIDLSTWNTESLTSTRVMFQNCTNIQEIDLTGWKTEKVTHMDYMFFKAGQNSENFKILGLNDFDTSSVSTMENMFYHAGANATTWNIGDLSSWDTSSVTDMGYMFYAAGNNASTWSVGDLSDWDISKVKFLDCTFAYAGQNATSWTVGNLDNWDVSNVLNMTSLFAQAGQNATTFNLGNLDNWDTAKVINMSNLFSNAGKNSSTWNVGDLSKWNTSNVTNMYQMFGYTGLKASTFDIGDLSTKTITKADGTTYTAWDTSKVTDMGGMFTWGGYGASTFDIGNIGTWDVSSVTKMNYMFNQAGCYATTWNIGDLSNWNTKSVTSLYGTFHMAGYNATTFNIGDLSTKTVTKADGTTYTAWDVSNVTTMYRLFGSAGRVASEFNLGDIGTWNISNLKEMQYMFAGAGQQSASFYVGDLSGLNTANVTNMLGIFENAGRNSSPITLDLSNWNTSKVTYKVNESGEITSGMNDMFTGMRRLHTITLGENFSTTGDGTCTFSLPTIDKSYFTNSDGKWYDVATGIGYEPNAIPTNTAATYSVELPIEAYAIYSETDNSLRFYKNADKVNVGDTYKDKIVTEIFTGIETEEYTISVDFETGESEITVPWIKDNITTQCEAVVVEDEIAPLVTGGWFMMFENTKFLNLTKLNTSKVTDMKYMFFATGSAAESIEIIGMEDWDTSKVTDMMAMFASAGRESLHFSISDISNWDTGNVTNMAGLFAGAGSNTAEFILCDLGKWNTENVTDMMQMFAGAGYLAAEELYLARNGGKDYFKAVTTSDIPTIEERIESHEITWYIGDLSNWDVSKVTDMSGMFLDAGRNTERWDIGDLSEWDVKNVTTMESMFEGAAVYSETFIIGNIANWNVGKVENMSKMFNEAGKRSGYNSRAMVSKSSSGYQTLDNASYSSFGFSTMALTTSWYIGDLSNWNVSNVTDMSSMFYSAGSYAEIWNIGNLNNWNVGKVTDMSYMFYGTGEMSSTWNIGNISNWNVSNVTDLSSMFGFAARNTSTFDIGDIGKWNVSNVENMYGMFNYAGYDAETFYIGDLSKWNTIKVTNMASMFRYAANWATEFNIGDISNWNTAAVTKMSSMFEENAIRATTWNVGTLSGWNTSLVTDMSSMFKNTPVEILDLSGWDTSKVTNMSSMFKDCDKLVSFNGGKELKGDLNKNGIVDWEDAKKCTELYVNDNATAEDIRIADIDGDGEITLDDATKLANYIATANTTHIKAPLNFVTTSVTNMSLMFDGCSSLDVLDLTTFNTSAVTNMKNMFRYCYKLEVVNLGPNFAFVGTDGYLPAQTSDNVENADGNWYNMETMVGYAPSAIPNNTAASYTSIINGTKISVDGLGDVITNDPDIELEYDPDDGTLGGAVPPSEDEPEEPAEMPEDKKPEIIEVGFGDFEPVTTYTPGTYKEVPYEQSFTKTKYPVSYLTVTWSEWTITKDADGNVISTTAGDMQLEDIDKVYSTWIVYDMETEKYLESNGVKGDSMEIWAPFIAEEDSLENMVYLAAYLNKIDEKTSRHIAKHDGTKYIAYDADAMISGVTCFTETYTVTGTKTVEVTKPSSSTEYVYVPIGTIRAEKDMTWETWLNSSYNTTGNKTPTIKTSDYVDVAYTDVIDENLDYGFIVYELDGVWLWNDDADFDTLMNGIGGIVNINFTSNGESFVDIYSAGIMSAELLYYKNESEYITAYGYLGATQGTAMVCSWNTDYQIIDFGSKSQEVSKEFYEWFVANAQEQMEVLSGVYIWNDEINLDVDEVYAEEVNYTSNGQQYTWLHTPNESRLTPNGTITESYAIHYGDNGNYMQSSIDGGIDVSGIGPMSWSIQSDLGIANPENDIYVWLDDAYKIIDFGSPQIVSKNFYDWFTANAKKTDKLTGTWYLNENVEWFDNTYYFDFYLCENLLEDQHFGTIGPKEVTSVLSAIVALPQSGAPRKIIYNLNSSDWGTEATCTQDSGYHCGQVWTIYSTIDEVTDSNGSATAGEDLYAWLLENATKTSNCTYDIAVTTIEATCTTDGEKTRTCTSCGETITQTIPATGHSYSTTYSSDATNHWQKCENCSSTTNTGAHSYGSWTTTKAATCTTAGSKYRTCGTCGYKQTQTIEKTGHDYSVSSSTAGDCNTASTTTYKCDDCGNTYTSTGDYGSHSYSVSSSTAGDCNTASTTTYRCSECGNTYTSTGSYGSHNYEYVCSTALTNAGCTLQECTECGATTGSHIDPCTHMPY